MRLVKAEERALDGLFAYHCGATDSGVSDSTVRVHMAKRVALLSGPERAEVARNLYGFPPYTNEDLEEFLSWLNDLAVEWKP